MTVVRAFLCSKTPVLRAASLYFRVLPTDCDINFHMTNSRYLSFLDLGRIYLVGSKKNLLKTVFKERWQPVVTGVDIKYIKAIKPFAKVRLKTRLMTWDERNIYMEQRFIIRGKTQAIALVQGAFIKKGRRVPMQQILSLCGEPNLQAPLPSIALKHWLVFQAERKQ